MVVAVGSISGPARCSRGCTAPPPAVSSPRCYDQGGRASASNAPPPPSPVGRCGSTRPRPSLACAGGGPAVWLRFGRPMHEDDPDGRCRRVYFRAGAVFARMQCPAPGRQQLAVLRAAGPGERIQCIARIEPGAQLLLHATTTARTELALQAIAAIETQRIAPDEVSEDYWRVLHQRLVAGVEAPPYTAAEHAAVTLRRAWPA